MKNRCRRIMQLLILFGVLVMMLSAPAQAKTVKAGKAWLRARTVKMGKTTVQQPSGYSGYVKFKAPKTKNYKIKFSKLYVKLSDGAKDDDQDMSSIIYLTSGGAYKTLRYKQDGQSVNEMGIVTPNYIKKRSYLNEKTSRTATVKLKKGQTMVIAFVTVFAGYIVYYDLSIS